MHRTWYLFIDLPQLAKFARFELFADVASCLVSNANRILLRLIVLCGLEDVEAWIVKNGLSVNAKKTCFMDFKLKADKNNKSVGDAFVIGGCKDSLNRPSVKVT